MGWLLLIFLLYFLCLLTERALVGLSPHDLEVLRSEESPAARRLLALSAEIRPALAALLLCRVLLVSLAGVMTVARVSRTVWLKEWMTAQFSGTDLAWAGLFSVVALGLGLVFWSLKKIDLIGRGEGRALRVLRRVWRFGLFWKTLFRPFAQKEKQTENQASQNTTHTNPAASEKRELELLKSIVQFGDVTVKQVMQPRSKVVSVGFKANFHELLDVVRRSEFSRLPVSDEDLDNVVGILYVKDLVPHLDKSSDFEWQSLIRTNLLVVPEAKRGSELLQEFKQQRMHMAVVVDEYGGMAGIATLEDILEEVTGDIRDEFDEENDIRYRKIDDFTYLFEGQTLLNDVCRIAGLTPGTFDPVRGASDTLAGLALELRGDIPHIGAEVNWNGFLITVIAASKRRIEQLKLQLPKP